MTPLLTWTWPETLIDIGFTIILGIVVQAVLVWAIRRITDAAVRRGSEHAASRTSKYVRVLARASGLDDVRHTQRAATLGSLLRSVSVLLVWGTVILTILTIIGIPLSPLLASAGIGGVALAFGAQSLVKDYLTGVFMILEDQFGVGDIVTIGDVSGTVEEVTLRVTRIQDFNGKVWYIRNGEIVKVGNLSQGFSSGLVDLPLAVDTDVEKALGILREIVDQVAEDPEFEDALLDKPTVLGVDSVSNSAILLRVAVKSPPNQQYGVMRRILEQATTAFAKAGIRMATTLPTVSSTT